MPERIFIISDLHIGGAFAPMLGHPEKLSRFLDELSSHQRAEGETIELVINGDFVDFLALPECEAWTKTESKALQKIEACFTQFGDVFAAIAKAANRVDRFTVLLGNHDIEMAYPRVRRRLLQKAWLQRTSLPVYHEQRSLSPGRRACGTRQSGRCMECDRLRQLAASASSFSRGEGAPAMEVCPGSRMVEEMVWPLKATYPFIDLLKPETKVLPLLLIALEPSKLDAFRKLTTVAKERWKQLIRCTGSISSQGKTSLFPARPTGRDFRRFCLRNLPAN